MDRRGFIDRIHLKKEDEEKNVDMSNNEIPTSKTHAKVATMI